MKRRWVIQTPPPEEEVDTLARQLHCSRVVALLLLQRGVRTVDEARAFFKPALNMLHDPFLMKEATMTWMAPRQWLCFIAI